MQFFCHSCVCQPHELRIKMGLRTVLARDKSFLFQHAGWESYHLKSPTFFFFPFLFIQLHEKIYHFILPLQHQWHWPQ